MRILGHFIVRLVTIAFGLLIAFLAAGLFLGFGFFDQFVEPRFSEEELHGRGAITVMLALIWSPFIAAAALGPALLLVAIAELARWRGLIANLAMGAVAALFTFWLNDDAASGSGLAQGTLVILLATGFIAGIAYWLVAGRKAGEWME